jgi:TonB-linked SusC/RagA family outer membrane protein
MWRLSRLMDRQVRTTGPRARPGYAAFALRSLAGALALLLALPGVSAAQETVVSGRVVAEQSLEPLTGAQVVVAGTGLGTLTDAQGRFRIQVDQPVGTELPLRVMMLGYRTATPTVRVGQTDVRVSLAQSAIELDEIVVTGTPGQAQKRSIGNVVSQVKAAEVVEKAPIQDVQQLLSNRVAGVVTLPGSGNVGTGSVTRVRGVSSLSLSNEPLIYVDGVRLNNDPSGGPNIRQGRQVNRLNDINPNDIESIEVIKGPAAATLYGTEASNGVIQIITKSGRQGKPVLDVTMKQGVNWMMNLDEKIPTVFSRDRATGELLSVNLYEQEVAAGRDPFQAGPIQEYGASLRGGTDQVRYYVSADYEDTEGIVHYNWQNKLTTRGNVDLLLSDELEVSANAGFVTGETRFAQAAAGWGVWDQFVWGSPARLNTRTRGFLRATPEVAGEIESFANIDRFMGGFQVNYRPTEWLAQRLTLGLDNGDETNSILFPRHPEGANYFFGGRSLGWRSVERRKSIYTTFDYSATGTFNLGSDFSSATSAGVQYYSKRFENVDALGQQFPAPSVKSVGGAAVTFAGEDIIENKTLGAYVQEQLSYDNRLFLTAAVRGDDNSAFGENYDFVMYPKLSASWVVDEEPFWRESFLSTLRLRGAWGRAGQQPDVFAAIRLYDPSTGPGDVSVLTPQAIGNPDLAPEVGEELELGFDAGLLDGRVGVNFTYYDQRTHDAIVRKQVSPSVGFPGFQFVNVGELHNWGTELEVTAFVLQREKLGWELSLNVGTNNNEVVDLGDLPAISFGGEQQHREGFPIGAIFYKRIVQAELGPDGRPINVLCADGEGGSLPCSEAPRVFWGTPTPTWQGAVSSTLTLFENLRLYGMVDFRGGHMIQYGDINASHTTFRNSRAINVGEDPILLAYDRLGLTDATGFMDAGFAKLREISGTYTLPSQWSGKIGASAASITVAGRNLATLWVAQEDIFGHPIPDPEVRTPGSNLSSYVQTVLPPFSQFVTTVRLSF